MKSNAKYFMLSAIIGIGILGISFFSCEKDEITPLSERTTPVVNDHQQKPGVYPSVPEESVQFQDDLVLGENCGKTIVKPLNVRGKKVGSVKIYNDEDSYFIEIESTDNYKLKRGFMHIAYKMSGFPLTEKGNPDYRRFMYSNRNPEQKDKMKFVVPLRFIKERTFITSLVCEVINVRVKPDNQPEPTGKILLAWAKGTIYGDAAPGTAFLYKKQNCLTTDAEINNEKE
jgi:hypothetical protein